MIDKWGAHFFAVAGKQLQHVGRDTRLVHQGDGVMRNERRLLGRLGNHRVARGKRRRDLTGKDGQGKIPRADAREHAAPV